MKTREDKNFIKNNIVSRAEKNKELYDQIKMNDIDKYDINSNATILDTNANNIDVDKIRDILDRKYRENIPEKSQNEIEAEEIIEKKYITKEYDINNILEKAREKQDVDYDKERLKKVYNTQYDILKNLNINEKKEEMNETEEEIMSLVNTITALEKIYDESSGNTTALDLLTDLSENSNEFDSEEIYKTLQLDKDEICAKSNENLDEEDLNIEEDYDDFKELEEDLKSNNLAIKIVIVIFVILTILLIVLFLNSYFNLGLFNKF